MNLIKFIAADLLFLVIANSKPVIIALGMSPIGVIVRIWSSNKILRLGV
jgi:hypothetical protein